MSAALPHPRPERLHLGDDDGDATPAPAALLTGPGRTWPAEARWARAQIRVGGQWRPARIEHWRLRLGSLRWSAQITWQGEDGLPVSGWYLCSRSTVSFCGSPVGASIS